MAKIKFDMEEAFKTVPEEPAGFREYCLNRLESIAIYYRREGKKAECTCGKCGMNFATNRIPIRNGEATCPICGHRGFWEWKRITKAFFDDRAVALIQCTTDNNLVVRLYRIHQYYQQYSVAEQKITESRRYFLYLGDSFKIHNGLVYTSKGWECRWGRNECEGIYPEAIYPGWKEQLKKSALKYCDIEKICGSRTIPNDIVEGLLTFSNNPAIEMYAKAGMNLLVQHLLIKEGKTKYINRRGKSISTQFRINDKERIRKLIEHRGDVRYLEIYQKEKKYGLKYTDEQVKFLVESGKYWKGTENVAYLLRFMTIQKLMNRIEKYCKQKGGYTSESSAISAYVDYLKMREELGYDMRNEVFLHPNNLKEKHDLMVQEKNARADELHMVKMKDKYPQIAERYKKLCKKYCFEKDGLVIRPAMNAAEIVAEGRELHHCVGREMYLKQHAEGRSFILFLRRKEVPDVPYYTIEIKDSEIVQWYGIRDTKPDEYLVKAWLNDFTDNLLNKNTKSVLQIAV